MSVKYVQGSNPLGTIGGVASLAGILTGTPWLVPVGMGLGIAGNVMSGRGVSAQDAAAFAGGLKNVVGTGAADNPASVANNPASTANNPAASTSVFANDDEASEFVKKYSRLGGYNVGYRHSL